MPWHQTAIRSTWLSPSFWKLCDASASQKLKNKFWDTLVKHVPLQVRGCFCIWWQNFKPLPKIVRYNACWIYRMCEVAVISVFILRSEIRLLENTPDSKPHRVNMRPTWILSAPAGPHVGPMNLALEDHHCRQLAVIRMLNCLSIDKEKIECYLSKIMGYLSQNWSSTKYPHGDYQ